MEVRDMLNLLARSAARSSPIALDQFGPIASASHAITSILARRTQTTETQDALEFVVLHANRLKVLHAKLF